MRDKIKQILENIRPSLLADGGDIEFIDVNENGEVTVRLTGACTNCPMSQMTLTNGVERILKQEIPQVKKVKNV